MEVYKIDDKNMTRIHEVDIKYERYLEDRLVRTQAAEIGGVEILYIGQQGTTEHGKQYDLVGVDKDGNLVIAELKRGEPPRDVIAQALDYVSRLRHWGYDELQKDYEAFLRANEYESQSLREAHKNHFNLEEPLAEDEFNTDQRMVIIGTAFNDAVTNMADYLRDCGELDVVLVQYKMYRDDEQDLELLTTNAIRRPLSDEPAVQSDQSFSKKEKRREDFWKEFQAKHQEHGLTGGNINTRASYAVSVFTSGNKNRPAYIRPKVGYDGASNAIRFYEGAREVVNNDSFRAKFETAVDEASSELDVGVVSHLSTKYDFDWDEDKTRDFDKVTITHEDSSHNEFQDSQKVEEIQQWLIDTTLVFKQALEQLEQDGDIQTE